MALHPGCEIYCRIIRYLRRQSTAANEAQGCVRPARAADLPPADDARTATFPP